MRGVCCFAGCDCPSYEQFLHEDDGSCVCGHGRAIHGPVRPAVRLRTPKFLYLRPTLGLCNRLRAIASALLFAEDVAALSGRECEIVLDWRSSKACGCDFRDLFDARLHLAAKVRGEVEAIAAAEALDALDARADKSGDPAERATADRYGRELRMAGVARKIKIGRGTRGLLRNDGRVWDFDDPYLSYECLFVEAMTFFYPRGSEELGGGGAGSSEAPALRALEAARSRCLRSLVPNSAVARRVVAPRPGVGALGVHVRRSDNHFAWMHSPIEGFVAIVSARLASADPPEHLFLATDDEDVREKFEERWRVATAPKRTAVDGVANRGGALGMQDALADLLSLSECDEVVGSFWSSFSRIAALWRDIPLTVVYVPYSDVPAAAKERAAAAFGLLEREPGEEPDLEINRAMLKITSGGLGRDDAKCDDVAYDDPTVLRGLLKALNATAEKRGGDGHTLGT